MLKIACFFTGDEYRILTKETPFSKKKIKAMALAMLVPLIIWSFNGYKLVREVLQGSVVNAVFCSIACAVLVFLLEKLIVMANGNKGLNRLRISIGVLVAIIGSIALDELIFKEDIDQEVASIRANKIQQVRDSAASHFEDMNQYVRLNAEINIAKSQYNEAVSNVLSEADGTAGTRKHGVGRVTFLKQKLASVRKNDLGKLEQKMFHLEQEKSAYVQTESRKADSAFKPNGLVVRTKALYSTVFNDWLMGVTYLVFTSLLFLLEFLVIFVKNGLPISHYERKLEMLEEVGRRRVDFLRHPDSPLVEPGNYFPSFKEARNSLKKETRLFN